MTAPALLLQLAGLADTLVGSAAAWRAVRSRVTRSFAAQDLSMIAALCAPLLLLGSVLAAAMVAALWQRVAPLSTDVAEWAVRALLVDTGPMATALLVLAMVLQRRVGQLWQAHRRGDFDSTRALGLGTQGLLELPWLAAHAAAGAAGATLWLVLGLALAPALASLMTGGAWAAQAAPLLDAITPLDPWMAALHGAALSTVVGAAGLVAAAAGHSAGAADRSAAAIGPSVTSADPSAAAADDASAGQAQARGTRLALVALVLAESLWLLVGWLLGPLP